jgi:virginiamycin A acetyltransferase
MINIDPSAKVSPLADIEDSVRGTRTVIGPNCMIDSFVKIKPVGGSGDVVIGSNTYINSGVVIYSGNGVAIGNDVLIAANCTFAAVNHEYHDRNVLIRDQGFVKSKGGIVVEDDVWIGAGCVVLDGARIARGCVIAAGSVVRGSLEPYSLNAGNPASKIAERSR